MLNIFDEKLNDFVIIPRKIKHDLIDGKLTKNEFDIILWIFICTNPFNGYFTANYKAIVDDFNNSISYVNIRKIISNLRKKEYIFFYNHKGKGGSFSIYPINFTLTNGRIQTFDYLTNKFLQNKSQINHNFSANNHNPNEEKNIMDTMLNDFNPPPQITTTDNDINNDNKNNNKYLGSKKIIENIPEFSPIKKVIEDRYKNKINDA